MSISILIADDQPIMRSGLRNLFSGQDDMQVVGEAGDGRVAVQMAQELSPNVVVMDMVMPNLNGVEATRQIMANAPAARVIAMSERSDRQLVSESLKAGACGYLPKAVGFDELAEAVRSVASGRVYLSPCVAHLVVDDYVHQGDSDDASAFSVLSSREREVLQLLAEGKSTKEVALRLKVSAKTIETHRAHIMEKLDLHSVAELTKYAIREGLTSLEV